MEIIKPSDKYFQDWSESLLFKDLSESQKNKTIIGFCGKVSVYFGLVGLSGEELAVIPNFATTFFLKYPLTRIYDFEIVFSEFREMPELKKVTADYLEKLFKKYFSSDLRKSILESDKKNKIDNSNKLPMSKEQTIKAAIRCLVFMFENYKAGKWSYCLHGMTTEHEYYFLIKNLGCFDIGKTDLEIIHESLTARIAEIQTAMDKAKGSLIEFSVNEIKKMEEKIVELRCLLAVPDILKDREAVQKVAGIARTWRIKVFFDLHSEFTEPEFQVFLEYKVTNI